MGKRTLLLAVMLLALVLNSAAQAQVPVTEGTSATVLTGGSYQLITTAQPAPGALTSDQYQLLPAAPAAGDGCCCKANLPCIRK